MKRTPRPYAQLILLSSQFERRIDKWFRGSVIFEIDLTNEIQDFEELTCVTNTLRFFDEEYSKATVVINPNETAITLCQLSGKFSRIIYVVGASGYTAFFSYCKCVSKFFELKNHIKCGLSEAIGMKRLSRFDVPEAFDEYKPSSSLSRLIREHDSQIGQLRSVLNRPFV